MSPFLDARGHAVRSYVTDAGLLILACDFATGYGPAALTRTQARRLAKALLKFADSKPKKVTR